MKQKKVNKNKYLRYSGMAFELFALLLILTYLGKKIDAYLENPKAYTTAFLLFTGLCAYLYKIVRDTSNES